MIVEWLFLGAPRVSLQCVIVVFPDHTHLLFLPVHRYIDDIFHVLVLQEYWVLVESRILLKPVLGGVRIVALSISSHEQTH